jgi:hypothetical protein
MQAFRKNSRPTFYKSDKKIGNDHDVETKYPFLQRFISETKNFRNELKQILKVCFIYTIIAI